MSTTCALAARTMRHIVIDHARRRSRQKRGGGQVDLPLHDEQIAGAADTARFLELDEALQGLERVDSRLVQVIECIFFAGLSEKETAEALGVTERTIQRDLRRAKDWLQERLRPALEYRELEELVRRADRLESSWGVPLDLEFAYEDDRLWILQARPIARASLRLDEGTEKGEGGGP